MSATTKRKPAAKKAARQTAETFFDGGATTRGRLQIAVDKLRLNAALERLSKLEARFGTRDDHAARLLGIECVLSAQNVILGQLRADLESRTVRGGFFGRLRWLFVGQ